MSAELKSLNFCYNNEIIVNKTVNKMSVELKGLNFYYNSKIIVIIR